MAQPINQAAVKLVGSVTDMTAAFAAKTQSTAEQQVDLAPKAPTHCSVSALALALNRHVAVITFRTVHAHFASLLLAGLRAACYVVCEVAVLLQVHQTAAVTRFDEHFSHGGQPDL